MQYKNDAEMQAIADEMSFPKKNTQKTRKWREIEALKARQQLSKELYDIDASFSLALNQFV